MRLTVFLDHVYFLASWADYFNPGTVAGTVAMLLAIGTYWRGANEQKVTARKDALETLQEQVTTLQAAVDKCEEHRMAEVNEKNEILFSYWKLSEANLLLKGGMQ